MDKYHNKPDHPAMCIYCGTIIQHDNYDFMCKPCIDKLEERQKKTLLDGKQCRMETTSEINNEYNIFKATLEGIKQSTMRNIDREFLNKGLMPLTSEYLREKGKK